MIFAAEQELESCDEWASHGAIIDDQLTAVAPAKTNIDFQTEIVPADSTRLPIDRSSDFGASPFLGQLSGKQNA